jgi:probable HAF family extracellular repeat protein
VRQGKREAGVGQAESLCAQDAGLACLGQTGLPALFLRRTLCLACSALLILLAVERADAASFAGLGFLSGDSTESDAYGISADGTTVAGKNFDPIAGTTEAFRWTSGGGMVGLGYIPGGGIFSEAHAVSSNGSVVSGFSFNGAAIEGFTWTAPGPMVGLGHLTGTDVYSAGLGISGSGSVVVGVSGDGGTGSQAFRYESGTMSPLGFLSNINEYSNATGVSDDGAVVVGASYNDAGESRAVRWTSGPTIESLGTLGTGSNSSANGISADGSTIVGVSDTGVGSEAEAFLWQGPGPMIGLGDLAGGGFLSVAQAVNADGSIIVGYSDAGGDTAFFWDTANGMRSIQQYLIDQGLGAPLAGWTLTKAWGISADGLKVVGEGFDPDGNIQAWYADLSPASVPEPGTFSLAALGLLLTVAGLARYRRIR